MPEGIVLPGPEPREEGVMWSRESIHVGVGTAHALKVLHHCPEEFWAELPIICGPRIGFHVTVQQ